MAKPTPGKRLTVAQRRNNVVEDVVAGYSYRATAARNHISKSQVARDVQSQLQALSKDHPESAQLRQLMWERLEDQYKHAYERMAENPDEAKSMGELMVRIIDRECKLFGLDSPQKVEHSTPEGVGIEITFKKADAHEDTADTNDDPDGADQG